MKGNSICENCGKIVPITEIQPILDVYMLCEECRRRITHITNVIFLNHQITEQEKIKEPEETDIEIIKSKETKQKPKNNKKKEPKIYMHRIHRKIRNEESKPIELTEVARKALKELKEALKEKKI